MVSGIDCDAATMSIILISVAFARFANCEFDAALQVIDAILALPHEVPTDELAAGRRTRGFDRDLPRRLSSRADGISERDTEQARCCHPSDYASVLIYWATVAALGMYQTDELVDEMRDALRRAESFGDVCGIITAQWAYGTALLRAKNASHDEAIDVLERAHTSIQKHKVLTLALPTIGADLAIDAARKGQRDEAIEELRASVSLHMDRGSRVFVGCAGEALVELLIDRGSARRPHRGAPNR